jgi:subtilisin family serine protease
VHAFHYQDLVLVAGTIDDSAVIAKGGPDVTGISRGAVVRGGSDLRPWGHLAQPFGSQLVNTTLPNASGVYIGFVDSGIDCAHPDFRYLFSTTCRISRSLSFVPYEPNPYQDLWGHGSAVASIAVANVNFVALWGAAPAAWFNVYKVADSTGSSTCDRIAAAIDQATYDLIDVINVSMQAKDNPVNRALCASVENAVNFAVGAGLLVVGIAGNVNFAGPDVQLFATYPNVLSVSGLTCGANTAQGCAYDAVFWEGSSSGAAVDLSAAASFVAVSTPTTCSKLFSCTGGNVRFDYGTSYAAPLVSAVAAMVMAKYPAARRQAQALAAHLKATAYTPSGGANALLYGAGILNAQGALASDPCLTQFCYLHPDP